MNKHSLSITILLSTFFSSRIFSANLLVDYDDQKEGDFSTQPNNQVEQPKQVCDYTILNNKNITQINAKDEKIEELQSMLGEIPKQPLDDNKKKELFKAIENNNLNKVKM